MAVEKSPVAWALTPLKKYAQFSGRAPRAELWWFMLFLIVSYFAAWFVLVGSIGSMAATDTAPSAGMLGALGGGVIIMGLLWLVLIIPSLAVSVRRLHDTNRSGWWLGVYCVLYAIYIVLLFGSLASAAATIPVAGASGDVGGGFAAAFLGAGLLGIALFVYSIVLLVFYCLPGTPGPNNYGPDPYGAQENLEGVFS